MQSNARILNISTVSRKKTYIRTIDSTTIIIMHILVTRWLEEYLLLYDYFVKHRNDHQKIVKNSYNKQGD